MIKTFTLNVGIEKRVRGEYLDEIQFDMLSTTHSIAGVGVKISQILKAFELPSHAYVMGCQQAMQLVGSILEEQEIQNTLIVNDTRLKVNTVYIDEDENCDKICEVDTLQDNHVMLFQAVVEDTINEEDVIVLEHEDNAISVATMQSLYLSLAQKSKVKVCDVHPDYWDMFAYQQADVLIASEQQCLLKMQKDRVALSEMIAFLQKEIAQYAKVFIYMMQCNDMLLFVEGKVYRLTCSVKQHCKKCYKEAVMSGVLKCYSEDGDLKKLSEECMAMSVAASLSEGLYTPNEEVLDAIKPKVMLYSL